MDAVDVLMFGAELGRRSSRGPEARTSGGGVGVSSEEIWRWVFSDSKAEDAESFSRLETSLNGACRRGKAEAVKLECSLFSFLFFFAVEPVLRSHLILLAASFPQISS